MKIGVSGYLYGGPYRQCFPDGPPMDLYAVIATKADELGFESFWMGDHIVFRTRISDTYPYTQDGVDPHHFPEQHRYDPWAVFTWLAGLTKQIRFCHGVYVLPMRHPLVTARGVTTLDVISKGRAMLGIGVGWDKEEFEDVSETFENRGKRSDEIIHIIRRLWSEHTIEHHGEHYSIGPVNFEPKPVQKPGPPIIIGGNSPAALRRAALLADGWYPAPSRITQRHELTEITQQLAHINEMRREAGRAAEPFDVTSSMPPGDTAQEVLDNLRRYEDAGITRVTAAPWPVTPPLTEKEIVEGLEKFAEEILSKL